ALERGDAPASNSRPSSGTASDVYTPPTEMPRTVYGPAVTVVSTAGVYGLAHAGARPRGGGRMAARDALVFAPGGRRPPVPALGLAAGAEADLGADPLQREVLLAVDRGRGPPAPAVLQAHRPRRSVPAAHAADAAPHVVRGHG